MKSNTSRISARKKKPKSVRNAPVNGRELDKKGDTRRNLIKAAQRVFAEKGFDAATVKDIAGMAGVNISLISYHFNGKAGIYRCCLEEFGKARLAAAQNLLKDPSSVENFRVRLQLFIEDVIRCHIEDRHATRMMERELISEMTKDIFEGIFRQTFQIIIQFIKDAQTAGFIRKDLDPGLSACLFFGGLIHLMRMDRFHKNLNAHSLLDKNFQKSIVQHALQNFMNGVLREST